MTVWNDNPGQEVTLENATTRITKIEYQNPALISKILMFLIRRGKINHGVFREAPVSNLPFIKIGPNFRNGFKQVFFLEITASFPT